MFRLFAKSPHKTLRLQKTSNRCHHRNMFTTKLFPWPLEPCHLFKAITESYSALLTKLVMAWWQKSGKSIASTCLGPRQ